MTTPTDRATPSAALSGVRPTGRRVALVIGSGSVKCAAALGLHRALAREEIAVDMVVGCSAGAIFASVIALGYDAETSAEMASRLWTRDLTRVPDRMALLRLLFPNLFRFDERWGMRNDRLVRQKVREAFGDRTFADTRIPLYITATDFHNGEQVVLQEGMLREAIRASIAIPFAFQPYEVGGRLLIDGFMSDPLPICVAMREGASVIVAMGFESPYQTRVTNAGRFAFQLSSIMTNNLLKAAYAFHGLAHHSEVIPVIPRFEQRIRLFDTEKIPYIVEQGERAMEEQMPYLRRLLQSPEAVAR